MSAPDLPSAENSAAGIGVEICRSEVTELAALRDRTPALLALVASCGLVLPPIGRAVASATALVLGVRPDRWLLLTDPAAGGASAAGWQELCAGTAAVIDQSAGLAAFLLTGPAVRDVLARGCRLDLAAGSFGPGHAAATSMAQVATILVALPAGILVLTPASTARHLHEWLVSTARPFGLTPRAEASVSTLFGHQDS